MKVRLKTEEAILNTPTITVTYLPIQRNEYLFDTKQNMILYYLTETKIFGQVVELMRRSNANHHYYMDTEGGFIPDEAIEEYL